jgi:hypothetical protein
MCFISAMFLKVVKLEMIEAVIAAFAVTTAFFRKHTKVVAVGLGAISIMVASMFLL